MRLEWLEDLLAVAETNSFSEAADRRHLTQSAFSRRIQNIEEYVGVELFDRTRKPVQLLDHTEAQREQITRLVEMLRKLATDLRRGDRMSSNRLIISSQHALTTSLTPLIIEELQLHRSDVFIRLRSANLADCFAQLLSRQADIAIVYRLPNEDHPIHGAYIESTTIGREKLVPVIAAHAADRLSASRDFTEVPYIAYPPEVFLGQVMERKILPRMRDLAYPSAKAETALTLAAIEMASTGIAVAWVPETLARDRIESGRLTNLTGVLPDCDLDVTAVRLVGRPGPVEIAVWERLVAFHECHSRSTGR